MIRSSHGDCDFDRAREGIAAIARHELDRHAAARRVAGSVAQLDADRLCAGRIWHETRGPIR
jgi:hypothetical protein